MNHCGLLQSHKGNNVLVFLFVRHLKSIHIGTSQWFLFIKSREEGEVREGREFGSNNKADYFHVFI